MRRVVSLFLVIAAIPWLAMAQRGLGVHRVDSNAEKVSVEGTVGTVSLTAGQGTCFLTVKQGEKEEKIILGSMRYLMGQNFDPKAGDAIKVDGFKLADASIAAKTIELTGKNKTISLRDDLGRPLWRGGPGNRGGRGPGGNGRGGRGPANPPAQSSPGR